MNKQRLTPESIEFCIKVLNHYQETLSSMQYGCEERRRAENKIAEIGQALAELNGEREYLRELQARSDDVLFLMERSSQASQELWTMGYSEDPVKRGVNPGSEISLGLHAICLALTQPNEKVPLEALDPKPLKDSPPKNFQAWSRSVSRARNYARSQRPKALSFLRRVKVHREDCTIQYKPAPTDPFVRTS